METIESVREHIRARDHVSIDLTHVTDALVPLIKEKMEDASSSVSISRVHETVLEQNKRAYIPENVSIGPFHRGRSTLKPMEDQKWRYVFALLNRNPNLESNLDKCVQALRELEHRTRRCYSEKINISSDEFVEMLLVDGGFIIELFIKYSNRGLRRRGDPIFSTPGKLYDLRCDMILIENQIPLFVLKRLFQIVPMPKQCNQPLSDLAYRFFRNMIPGEPPNLKDKFSEEAHHLLDLVHNCLLPLTYPREPPSQSQDDSESAPKVLKCVTELKRRGIRLQKADNSGTLVDITFTNGVIHIPRLKVDQSTELLFRNLVALEQCQCVDVPCVSSYVHMMSSLLCTERDEKFLEQRGINMTSSDCEVKLSTLFKYLCTDLTVEVFYYRRLIDQVDKYRARKRKERRVHWGFVRSASHPRLILVAVVTVLVLTLMGTLFSALSFFLHHD